MTTVLFVVTSADYWTLKDGSIHPSGFWGEELAIPHKIFTAAGWDITIATPGGVPPTLDQLSMGRTAGRPEKIREVAAYLDSIHAELDNPQALDEVDETEFDVVFYPGGHGPMEDLASDPVSGALLTRRLASGRPLALLCHSPAAALAARNDDGSWPFAGYRMTGLSNAEERLNTFGWKAPRYLEDRLKENGADYSKALLPLRPMSWSTATSTPARIRSPPNNWPNGSSPISVDYRRCLDAPSKASPRRTGGPPLRPPIENCDAGGGSDLG